MEDMLEDGNHEFLQTRFHSLVIGLYPDRSNARNAFSESGWNLRSAA